MPSSQQRKDRIIHRFISIAVLAIFPLFYLLHNMLYHYTILDTFEMWQDHFIDTWGIR